MIKGVGMRIGDLFKCELGRGILEVIEIIDDENFILHGEYSFL